MGRTVKYGIDSDGVPYKVKQKIEDVVTPDDGYSNK